MRRNIKILLLPIILLLLLGTHTLHAAFNGTYTFQLEPATQVEIDAISTPLKGMMLYNTTSNEINYYTGTAWMVLNSKSMYDEDNQLTANREVNLSTFDLAFTNGSVGIGDSTPDATLDVAGSMRVDGSFYDKDGDAGIVSQLFTSTGIGMDWTSSATAPNLSNTTISVPSSSTTTITLTGTNFIPSTTVSITGFDGSINSTNVLSPVTIEVNITTGAAGTFDIVISNNGILNTQWAGNGVGLLQVN